MNTGQRGNAYGFRLESLLKISEVRSGIDSRRHTLLHYLVDVLEKQFPDIYKWTDELSGVESASKGIRVSYSRSGLILFSGIGKRSADFTIDQTRSFFN